MRVFNELYTAACWNVCVCTCVAMMYFTDCCVNREKREGLSQTPDKFDCGEPRTVETRDL